MTDKIVVPGEVHLSTELTEIYEEARTFAAESKSENTRKAYRADWKSFSSWCGEHNIIPMPAKPETIVLYITHMANSGRKSATINRALVSISQSHKLQGFETPTGNPIVREVLKGIRRKIGTAQREVAPVVVDRLKKMIDVLPDNPAGVRDKTILLIGFTGAFRRSELVSIDVEDLQDVPEGIIIFLRRSKTDQNSHGRKIGIPFSKSENYCPVRSCRQWLSESKITSGPIFRSIDRHGNISSKRLSDRAVANIIKRTAEMAGLDPSMFSGHSLRSGFITSAAAANKSERRIMAVSNHKSERIMRKYIRDGSIFVDHAGEGLL